YRRRGAISCAGQLANGKTRTGQRCRLLHDGIIMRSYRPSSSRRWAVRGLTFRVSCSICRGTLRRRSRRDPPLIHAAVVPQLPGSLGRIDAGILPPGGFIAYAVHQSVMDSTQRHRELIARLATHGPRLQVAQMMGVGRLAATEEAGLLGDVAKVRLVAITAGSGNRLRALGDARRLMTTGIARACARADCFIAR